MSALPDLVALPVAADYLSPALPVNQHALPFLVKAASSQIRRYCKRDFSQIDYTQFAYANLLDGRGYSELLTKQYPVNWISRLSISPTTILSVSNTDGTTNQRATATLTVTGDVASGLVVTGLALSRLVSGVMLTDQILFATYVTVGAAATAITALGGGWKGTAAPGMANWPTAEILPTTGAQAALSPGQAEFQAYTQDVSGYDFDPVSGIIRLRNQTFDPVFALMNLANTSMVSTFPIKWRGCLINYNAGYAVVPEDVQQACLVCIKDWIYHQQIITYFQSESDVDFSYTISPLFNLGLSRVVKEILQPHRSFRQF